MQFGLKMKTSKMNKYLNFQALLGCVINIYNFIVFIPSADYSDECTYVLGESAKLVC